MRDYLLDLVEHTYDLGCINLVKITGTEQDTVIDAIAEDNGVVVQAKFKNPMPDFIGTFGMPNLSKLKIILNLQEYKEDASITVTRQTRNDVDTPTGVHFENKTGDFKNDYRFMTPEVIAEKLKVAKFKGVPWHVEFEPTVASIQRLKMQMQANTEETKFQAKTENGNLVFSFGDHSTHAGNFVFQPGVTGTLKRSWAWPAAQVMSILTLTGDKVMQISDDGAIQITVDSGIGVYTYILLAHTK
jgi:hypothetical protein